MLGYKHTCIPGKDIYTYKYIHIHAYIHMHTYTHICASVNEWVGNQYQNLYIPTYRLRPNVCVHSLFWKVIFLCVHLKNKLYLPVDEGAAEAATEPSSEAEGSLESLPPESSCKARIHSSTQPKSVRMRWFVGFALGRFLVLYADWSLQTKSVAIIFYHRPTSITMIHLEQMCIGIEAGV